LFESIFGNTDSESSSNEEEVTEETQKQSDNLNIPSSEMLSKSSKETDTQTLSVKIFQIETVESNLPIADQLASSESAAERQENSSSSEDNTENYGPSLPPNKNSTEECNTKNYNPSFSSTCKLYVYRYL